VPADAMWLGVTIDPFPEGAGEVMNDLLAWRIVCRYLILGLVFVPSFALWLHEKPRPAGPEGDRGRASIAHGIAGNGLHVTDEVEALRFY
jgi:hypothetical protein